MQEQYKFKVGDKVKYKEDRRLAAAVNGHCPDKVYTIKEIDIQSKYVLFEGNDTRCKIERLDPVHPNRHKHADLMIAYANDSSLEFQYRKDEGEVWGNCVGKPAFHEKIQYRIKPKTVTKYQVLYLMTNYNMANVTGGYFSDEQDFLNQDYQNAKFIQLIKETAKEFEVQ